MRRPGLLALRNAAKAILMLGLLVAAPTALGWWLGGVGLGSAFLGVMLLIAGTLHVYGHRFILASLRARELVAGEAGAVLAAAERLARASGVGRPRLYLLDDGHPRALSVGRARSDPAIGVSRGLLALLPPAELEAVLAHELAKVRHLDVIVQTPAVILATWLLEASRIGGYLQRALLFFLAPLAAGVVQLPLSPKRIYAADRAAAAVCAGPHALADALLRLEQAQELVSFQASPATEPLYTLDPFAPDRLANLFATHPTVPDRVRRLRALDPGWRERLDVPPPPPEWEPGDDVGGRSPGPRS